MKRHQPYHKRLLVVYTILLLLGLLNQFSASATLGYHPFYRQLLWSAGGVVLLLGLGRRLDYRILGRISWWLWGLGVVLLGLVLISGRSAGGATRWIALGPIALQPSELAKFTTLILVASLLAAREAGDRSLLNLFLAMMALALPSGMILVQPDLGTAGSLLISGSLLFVFLGMKPRLMMGLALVGLLGAATGWQFVLKPYQKSRIITVFNPESNPAGAGYQVIQSKIAIGNGGLTGMGFGQGRQTQGDYLPEHHTDFAFAVWAEEWGLAGSLTVLLLFFWFLWEITDIGLQARESLGTYLVVAAAAYFAVPFAINLLMVLGWFPTVGIALPFFTYGGSHTLAAGLFLGLVQAVYTRRNLF